MGEKIQVPAVDGWFTLDENAPALIGTRGTESGSYFFPKAIATSANPNYSFEDRQDVELSRRGRVWSYSTNHYRPPAPYVSPEPFVPYTVLAVELEVEQFVVLGLLAAGHDVGDIRVGTEVELTLGVLYEDDEHEYMTWNWQPVAAPGSGGAA